MVLHSGNFMEKQEEQRPFNLGPQYFDLCRTASEEVGVAISNDSWTGAWERGLGGLLGDIGFLVGNVHQPYRGGGIGCQGYTHVAPQNMLPFFEVAYTKRIWLGLQNSPSVR